MPSSQKALKEEIRALHAQCGALEAIILLQNGAMDEMGKIVAGMHGGAMARIKEILARHGVKFPPERPGLQ